MAASLVSSVFKAENGRKSVRVNEPSCESANKLICIVDMDLHGKWTHLVWQGNQHEGVPGPYMQVIRVDSKAARFARVCGHVKLDIRVLNE